MLRAAPNPSLTPLNMKQRMDRAALDSKSHAPWRHVMAQRRPRARSGVVSAPQRGGRKALASRASTSMRDQSPRAIDSAGIGHEPPTHTICGTAR